MKEIISREKELIDYLRAKRQLILYGAGRVGGLVKSRLESNGLADRIVCFAQTVISESDTYMGIKVSGLDSLTDFNSDACILVCALSATRTEMIRQLNKRGLQEYLIISEELISDLEEQYLSEQQRLGQGAVSERFDVIFFSQDNNSTSGAFISMAGLCDEIQRGSGLKILVVLPRFGDGEKLLKEYGLEYAYVNRRTAWIRAINVRPDASDESRTIYNAEEIEQLRLLIRNAGARLVHISGMFVFAGAIAAREEQVPVIWHIRENITTQGNCFINEEDSYQLLNASRAVVCVSDHVYQAYPGLDEKAVRIIYNGIDDRKFYEKRDIFTFFSCRIVMVGYITPLKGQEVLVRALAYLKNKKVPLPYVTFVGGGDSNYLEYLKEMIVRANLERYITFAGRTLEPETYYRQSDIAISATNGGEGFDRVRIEAMLSGCILIANDVGAAREIVRDGETGYLFEDGSPESLAETIMKAVNDMGRSRAIAREGQRLCMEKFTKKRNAEQVLALYREVLGADYGRQQDVSAGF